MFGLETNFKALEEEWILRRISLEIETFDNFEERNPEKKTGGTRARKGILRDRKHTEERDKRREKSKQ